MNSKCTLKQYISAYKEIRNSKIMMKSPNKNGLQKNVVISEISNQTKTISDQKSFKQKISALKSCVLSALDTPRDRIEIIGLIEDVNKAYTDDMLKNTLQSQLITKSSVQLEPKRFSQLRRVNSFAHQQTIMSNQSIHSFSPVKNSHIRVADKYRSKLNNVETQYRKKQNIVS